MVVFILSLISGGLFWACILYWSTLFYDTTYNLELHITCQMTYFLCFFPGQASVWILVAMTAEKTFHIFNPLKANVLCNVKSAKIVSALTTSVLKFFEK